MTLGEEWIGTLPAARDPVDGWIGKVAPHGWLVHGHGQETRKDLPGHLTAGSGFLLDHVEVLRENRPDAIEAIELGAWNAVEVDRRRNWTVEAIPERSRPFSKPASASAGSS